MLEMLPNVEEAVEVGERSAPATEQRDRRIEIVYDALASAAERGLPCPGNEALAEMAGVLSDSSIVAYIGELEAQGRVSVLRRGRNVRQIGICETGVATAPISPRRGHMGAPQDHPRRDRGCRFIEGDPRHDGFCNAPAKPGSSYCEAHHARCYRRPRPKEEIVE